MEFQSLLVVIDPSQTEQPALQRAAWLARQTAAHLELLLCEHQASLDGHRLLDAATRDKARAALLQQRREWLERLAQPLREEGLTVACELRWGKPLHQQILNRVTELQPDLLFKAARNHGLWRRLFLSNSCWQLIRHSPVPLWLVHHGQWSGHNRLCAALDPLHSADKPAALDHRLIRASQQLAERLGLQPSYLHCYAPLPRSLLFDAELVADYEDYVQACAAEHRQAFDALLGQYPQAASQGRLLQGYAEELIPQFVREQHIDLLLMGAVSRGHLDTALIGNTAERILEEVDCDLLVFGSAAKSSAREK